MENMENVKIRRIIFGVFLILCFCFCIIIFFGNHAVYAEEPAGAVIWVDEYDLADNYSERKYTNYKSNQNWNEAFNEIRNTVRKTANMHTLKCCIELQSDITVPDLSQCDYFPMEIEINLKGHTLQLNYNDYWYINNGLTINGDGGVIKSAHSEKTGSVSVWITNGDLRVNNVTFSDIDTMRRYPLFGLDADVSSAYLTDCWFNNCRSTAYGGAIYMDQTNILWLKNCHFENCSSYYGGAIYLEDMINSGSKEKPLDFQYCSFKNCSATRSGGAIYMEDNLCWNDMYDRAEILPVTFECTEIKNCSAGYYGGAICADGDDISIGFMIDSPISDCSAGYYGGAICFFGKNSDVSGADIGSCRAEYGGGIYIDGYFPTIMNCTVHHCTASEEGSAYYVEDTGIVYIKYNTFYDNANSNGNATLMSGGSTIILLGIATGISIITAIVFMVMYFRNRKKQSKE